MLQETWSSYHVSPKHCPQKRQEGEMPWISLQFLKAVILQPGRMIAISWLWSLSQGWTFLPCWKLKELSPQTQRCLSAHLLGSGDQWDQCGDSVQLRRETWNPKPLIDLIGDKKHVKTPLFPYGIFPAIHWMTVCANANRRQSTFRRQITKDILEALAVPWYHCPWYSIMMMEHQLQMEVLAEIII